MVVLGSLLYFGNAGLRQSPGFTIDTYIHVCVHTCTTVHVCMYVCMYVCSMFIKLISFYVLTDGPKKVNLRVHMYVIHVYYVHTYTCRVRVHVRRATHF